MPPRGFLVVYASARNITDPELDEHGWLHTNFSLNDDGEYLALVAADGSVLHEYAPNYPRQVVNVSYGLTEGLNQYFASPTPVEPNQPGVQDLVADPTFSRERGFYREPLEVEISTSTPGATLVYTSDGRAPTLSRGIQVGAPPGQLANVRVTVDRTTTLRAAAFRTGWVPTDVVTQTYLFVDDNIAAFGPTQGGPRMQCLTYVDLAPRKEDLRTLTRPETEKTHHLTAPPQPGEKHKVNTSPGSCRGNASTRRTACSCAAAARA